MITKICAVPSCTYSLLTSIQEADAFGAPWFGTGNISHGSNTRRQLAEPLDTLNITRVAFPRLQIEMSLSLSIACNKRLRLGQKGNVLAT